MSLQGKVCVVTGASRGVGKGIALALGGQGATVYVTGRSLDMATETQLGGTLNDTAQAITARGGRGIAVACDHGDDEAIRAIFEQCRSGRSRSMNSVCSKSACAPLTLLPGMLRRC